MKRQPLVAVGVFAVLGLMLIVCLVSSASAGRAVGAAGPSVLTFSDPAGDASAGAPDITKVAVNGDQSTGMISFSVTATGLQPASPDGLARFVDIWLDTDRNAATGDPAGGSEYDIYAYDDLADPAHWWSIDRWNGSSWEQAPYAPTMSFVRSGDLLTWTVNKADLGGAASFALDVSSAAVDASGNLVGHDEAPDNFSWVYDIAGPAKSMTMFLTPVIGKPVMTPTRVMAGKRVTVTFPVTRPDAAQPKPLTSGTMVCDPSIGGKVIPHAESFTNGVARLSFVVPKTAKGKLLKVKVTIKAPTYRGEDGTSVDIATGQLALVAQWYQGQSATKIASFLTH